MTSRRLHKKGKSRSFDISIVGMLDREDARIVGESEISKNLKCPPGILSDGKTWGPVAFHRLAAEIFEKGFSFVTVCSEFSRSQFID